MRRFNLWARHRNGADWNHGNDAGLTLVPAAIGHMRIRWNFAGIQLKFRAVTEAFLRLHCWRASLPMNP